MKTKGHINSGFTLIEIVIALVVFSIVSVTASSGLNAILKWQTDLNTRSEQIKAIQLTLKYLERDINRAINRSVRDQYGDPQPALSSDGENAMNFTYSGWRNPANLLRSHLQRVAYELDSEKEFTRHSWNRLDGAIVEDAREIVLLEEVEEFELEFLNQTNTWIDQWPPINSVPAAAPLPRAISISLNVAPFGEIKRIFTVPE